MGMVSTRNSAVRRPEPGVNPGTQQHQELTPTNPRLWNIVVMQAKARFHKWPSPAASHWAHEKYKQMGGRFKSGGGKDDDDRAKRLASHQRIEKAKDDGGDADKKDKKKKHVSRKR